MSNVATGGGSARAGESARVHVTGWVVFGSVLLIIAGAINLVNGFTALQHDSYYTRQIVYTNLTFWGWAFLIWGALQLVAGIMAWGGRETGNLIGASLAGIACLLWFFMIFAAPWAAFVGFGLNMMVVFALTAGAHPDEW